MVDAVGGVAKIVGVALKIKEAANMVHQNKKDCRHIKSRVDILNRTLSHHVNNDELMADSAVMAALEALEGMLAEALVVVIECQEKRNIICVYYSAGNLSRKLSKVEQRISYLSSDAMLTIMSYQLLRKSQEGAPHPPPQMDSQYTLKPMQPPSQPEKMSKENQDKANKKVETQTSLMSKEKQDDANKKDQTQASRIPKFGAWDVADTDRADGFTTIFNKIRDERTTAPRLSPHAGPRAKRVCQPRSLVNRISEVARSIKEAAETVLQNSDDCVEIAKRVNKVSILLPQLEDTKMADEPAMRGALEKLLVTFRRTHTLVIACQRRGLGIVWLSTLPGRLSTQLHEVLDEIASNIANMTAIVLA
ncbi:hypothetical protein QYE76_039094 [Lolium multiflorum]|uniref:RIN4 pathogenic type III effector avirulence factor Avr cleavage site domain-containing protein n=1 Tax=Lolium multiflorum TaxID=4521 RepID=A0AAD8T9A0_LOLMU|nr:hypothetical protein QYE76_039094 [Lolium multiflorum]